MTEPVPAQPDAAGFFAELRDAIVHGEIAPGIRLRDTLLARRYGTSRAIVHDTLVRLAGRGLVRESSGGTFVVTEADPDRVRWARELVGGLYALSVTLCDPEEIAQRFGTSAPDGDDDHDDKDKDGDKDKDDDDEVESLLGKTERGWMKSAIASLRLAVEAGDTEASIAATSDFHGVALEACGNPLLTAQLGDLLPILWQAEYREPTSILNEKLPKRFAKIVKALKHDDFEKAANLTRAYWR